jgi:hypothetical protein
LDVEASSIQNALVPIEGKRQALEHGGYCERDPCGKNEKDQHLCSKALILVGKDVQVE